MTEPTPETEQIEMGGMVLLPGEYIGPYRYTRPIGKGGMADVLLATDPSSRQFALKVLKASRFKTGRERFGREFRALTRLRHPNVISVDSFGDIFGHPYIAMEYIEGTDLHLVIRTFRDFSLSQRWQRTKSILIDLCHALSYIHSRGFVHRDLKPSNVLITNDGQCKLTDFGIVKDLNPALDDHSTTLVGTWAYSSPEQIGGQDIDHRSDLYSLGIILYAMLTSRRPFAAKNMAGYLKLHKEKNPKSPSEFIPEVPPILESICLKLLQKSPQDRFQSANDILILLGQAQPNEELQRKLKSWELPFNSTHKDRAVIKHSIKHLESQGGKVLILSGPAGYGKSSLLKFATQTTKALQIPAHLFVLHANQNSMEMMVGLAEQIRKESAHDGLSRALMTFSHDRDIQDRNIIALLFDEIHAALKSLLEERPQVILIDSLEHGSNKIFELITILQQSLIDRLNLPLLICGTIDGRINTEWLQKPWEYLSLTPLNKEDILSLLKASFNTEESLEDLAKRLHEETDGVPLFLTEYIRYLITIQHIQVQDGHLNLLTPPNKIALLPLEVPPSIRELARKHYQELSPIEQSIMSMMATLARESDYDFLLDLLCENTEDEEKHIESITRLSSNGMLLSRNIGITQLIRIERQKIADVIYEDLGNLVRVQTHIRIAEVLEKQYKISKDLNFCQQIGEHYRRAEKPSLAYKHLSIAAMELLERGLIAEALALCTDVHPMMRFAKADLSHIEFLNARCNLLQVQSGVTRNRGEWKENAKALRTLLRYARELENWNLEMTSSLYLGQALINLGQEEEGENRLLNTLEACKSNHNRNLIIASLHHLCQLEWAKGDIAKCEQYATEALMRTTSTERTISRANSLLSLSAIQAAQGHLQEAQIGMEETCLILEHLNRKEKLTTVLCNLGEVYIWQGKWSEGLKRAKTALSLAKTTLHRTGELQAILTISMAHYAAGNHEEMVVYAHKSLRLAKTLNIHTHIIVSSALLAIAEKDPVDALIFAQRATEHSTYSDPEHYRSIVLILEEICRIEAKQPPLTIINQEFITHIDTLPVPRRIEGWLYLAHFFIRSNNLELAKEFAHKANQTASLRKMLTHALRARQLLCYLLSKGSEPQIHEQYKTLRSFLIKQLPENDQSTAKKVYFPRLEL